MRVIIPTLIVETGLYAKLYLREVILKMVPCAHTERLVLCYGTAVLVCITARQIVHALRNSQHIVRRVLSADITIKLPFLFAVFG